MVFRGACGTYRTVAESRALVRLRSFTLEQIALAPQRGRARAACLRAQVNAAASQRGPRHLASSSAPFLPPLITLVVVLGGSFSGIRQQRSGIADDRQLGRRRSDGRYVRPPPQPPQSPRAAQSESQIRPRKEGRERKPRRRRAPTRPSGLRLRCAAAAAAAIGVRFSERLMCRKENLSDVFPSISFPSYFYNGLTVSQENFKANFLKLKSASGEWSGESGTSSKYN